MNFSIVAPLFNEEGNIFQFNFEVAKFINSQKEHVFELIYIDDCSNDSSLSIILEFDNEFTTKIVKHRKNLSQAEAIRTGVKFASYENLIFIDTDLQNNINDLNLMILNFEKGFDMIIGNRKNRKDEFFFKKLPSLIANKLVRIMTKSKAKDHGCALKVLKRKVFDSCSILGDFHRLLAAQAFILGYKIKELNVSHRPRLSGKSNYGLSRVFRVLLDLVYLNFTKNYEGKSLYFFGKFCVISITISLIIFFYMIFLKYFSNISFIQTPLPILAATFFLMSINFLLIGVLSHSINSKNVHQIYKDNVHQIYKDKDNFKENPYVEFYKELPKK